MYHVDVTWKEETIAICSDTRGNEMLCDWENENSLSPVQIMVQMVGVCSMAEIVVGMKEREFDSLSIGIDYERNDENPRYVTKINLKFKLNTDPKWEKLIRRLIEQTMNKYCSVASTLSGVAKITWDLELN
ncbi:MAG TPA: OsmC family protein [Candidatus Poseidoniaceae archaeon]|jgi:putative redox protein|nr:OsmC family protein [Candidatus Poseidoniaceae archaeon]